MSRVLNIILLCSLVVSHFFNPVQPRVCELPECEEAAWSLLTSLDVEQDPCQDFFEFACAKQLNSLKQQQKVEGFMPTTTFTKRLHDLRKTIKKELAQPYNPTENRAIGLAKTFWQSCLKTHPEEALEAVRIVLRRLGGWPVIEDNWQEEHFTWEKFSKCARLIGFLPRMFIHVGINYDHIDKPWSPNDTIALTVDRAKWMFRKNDIMKREDQVDDYVQIAEKISESPQNERRPPISFDDIIQAVNFGKQLYMLTHGMEPPVLEYKEMTIAQLQKDYPIVDWMDYIRSMLTKDQANYLSDRNCVIAEICFLSQIDGLLKKTSKRVLANYAMLSIIDDLFSKTRPLMPLALSKTRSQVHNICFATITSVFGKALDMMVARLSGYEIKRKVTDVQNDIAQQAHQLFQTVPWMDHPTQLQAKKKSDRTTFVNVYEEGIFDDNYYDRLQFSKPEAILVLFRELNHFLVDRYYLQLGRPRNQYLFRKNESSEVSAIFKKPFAAREVLVTPDRVRNEVYIPAGAVGKYKLSLKSELDFLNFAAVGLQIGAAMGHHLYGQGAFIDWNNNWRINSWWTPETQKQYSLRTACSSVGPLEPTDILAPSFAYLGGAEIAYKAMFDANPPKACNTTLPGLNYSTRQLFWIASVATDCDSHLKDRYNNMVMHNCHFAEDFKCAEGTPMNPIPKCTMWV